MSVFVQFVPKHGPVAALCFWPHLVFRWQPAYTVLSGDEIKILKVEGGKGLAGKTHEFCNRM